MNKNLEPSEPSDSNPFPINTDSALFNQLNLNLSEALPPSHGSDIEARMERMKLELIGKVGAFEPFAEAVGQIIRAAVDYVIDAPVMRRYSLSELEPDEKTTIGKRIERLFRLQFDLVRGEKLDIKLGREDVDIKTTMGSNWMFPPSSYGHVNLLIKYTEGSIGVMPTFSIGLNHISLSDLGERNRDGKRSIKGKEAHANIMWIIKDRVYPSNFLSQLPTETLEKITQPKTGMKRVLALLRLATGCPIPRHVICSVANQKDPLRRVRSNGGARDVLWKEGILVLSGAYSCDRDIGEVLCDKLLADDELLTFHEKEVPPDLVVVYRDYHQLPEGHKTGPTPTAT